MSAASFPPGFLWGVATSAQQIEGTVAGDGRGASTWDRFAATPGAIADGSDPRVACDHYRRWRDDLDLLGWLGVNAYRFSTGWSRVLPGGFGPPNPAGLDFYDALVDALLERGIRPFLTLDHWDPPQALQERGGWAARTMIDAFEHYADVVSRRLGDRVRHWVTHNEPWCVAHLGHERGVHAPGVKDPAAALRVAHHLLVSHGRAVEVLRRNAPGAEAGIVHMLFVVQPASDSAADREAARRLDGTANRWYLEPLHRGAYPADVIADHARAGLLPGGEMPFVEPGDLRAIATPTDFLGINYYSRSVVRGGPDGEPVAVPMAPEGELTAMGWEVHPQGLYDGLLRVHADYAPRRVHVTENGAAFDDPPPPGDPAEDPRRVDYLERHFAAAARAVADGVPLQGFFVWSFLDNFEWNQGFARRFGLFHVDYRTLRRSPRRSAHWYRAWLSAGANAATADPSTTRSTP